MEVRDSGGPVEVDDEMAVGRDFVHQRIQGTILNDLPLVDDDYPLAQLLDIAQIVGGQDDSRFVPLIDLLDELPDGVFRLHIQADGGLVQKQYVWGMEHGRHQIAPHPLTKRELPHRGVDEPVDLEDLVECTQVLFVVAILDLIDSLQQLKSLAQPQVPVQLAALAEHHAQVAHHPFAVPLR